MPVMTSHELVFAAVTRLNEMARQADQADQGQDWDGPFVAQFAEAWQAISFLGEHQVWCPATDMCDTPETGETVDSIIHYVWHYELKDLAHLLNALAPLMPEYIEPKD